jgi:hypothetical protein
MGPHLSGPARCARSTVDRCRRGQRARRRAHQSLASARFGAPKLTGGGAKRRGERGELGSGLTEARAALWRLGDGGAEWGAVALSEK